MVKLGLVVILCAVILALIGILKPEKVPKWLTVASIILVILGAAFEIILLVKQSREESTEKYAGVIESKSKIPKSSDQKIVPKLEIANTGTIIWLDGGDAAKFIDELLKDNNFKAVIEEGRLLVCFGSAKFGPLMIFLKRWFAYNETIRGETHEYQEKVIA